MDLDRGAMVIRRQRTTAGGRVVQSVPKSRAGNRTVSLDAETVRLLAQWRRVQREEMLRLGVRPRSDWVVTNLSGGPLDPDELTKMFTARTTELGLPRIRLHDLRHAMATNWAADGVPMVVIQERLGHSTAAITERLYVHARKGADRAASDAFAAQLDARKSHPV